MIKTISFGYKSIIKTLYKDGELPTVVKDIYGKPLNADTVTLEHIIPKSKGGKSNLKNYALANAEDNFKRSSQDIMQHTTKSNINQYLDQFTGIVKQGFNGDDYIKNIKNLFKSLGVKLWK